MTGFSWVSVLFMAKKSHNTTSRITEQATKIQVISTGSFSNRRSEEAMFRNTGLRGRQSDRVLTGIGPGHGEEVV